MDEEEQPGFDLDKISQDLSAFLEKNPHSRIELGADETKPAAVREPWGDPSVAILIPNDEQKRASLSEVLNNVILPSRLSAIYGNYILDLAKRMADTGFSKEARHEYQYHRPHVPRRSQGSRAP